LAAEQRRPQLIGERLTVSVLLTPAAMLADYETWLAAERGLQRGTIDTHLRWARRWLEWVGRQGGDPHGVDANMVGQFTAETAAACRKTGTAKTMVVSLRVFLQCAFTRGWTGADLRGAVPRAASWRGAQTAKALPRGAVEELITSCDVSTVKGRRNKAILFLLARLGLRRIEVARLTLADIDWRSGTVAVTGKGGARDQLPLPSDVGEALAAYVAGGRPQGLGGAVFFTVWPPIKPITPATVSSMVRDAAVRGGMGPIGPHRLRHTLACEMLRAGAGLEAVGQVLRHKDISSTSIYAKADSVKLSQLAMPWPSPQPDGRARL
jgi:site-specific recombinase XerD